MLKRKLREIVRVEILSDLPAAIDVVVKTRPNAYRAEFSFIAYELGKITDEITRLFA